MEVEELLNQLKDGQDHHRFLAAYVLGKAPKDVTAEERRRFKEAFFALFHFRGPTIFKDCLDDLRELMKVPEAQAHLKEVYKKKEG